MRIFSLKAVNSGFSGLRESMEKVKDNNGFIKTSFILTAIMFYAPLSVSLATIAGKPVDIVFSDVVVMVLVIMYFPILISRKVTKLEGQLLFLVVGALSFFLILAVIGYIETGNLTVILSSIKYEKAFLALLAGMFLSRVWTIEKFWKISITAILIIVFALSYSQFFQMGSFSPRWGEMLLGMPIYGYPNSSASYFLIYVSFLCVALFRGGSSKLFIVGVILSSLFMLMSLSRSAFVVLTLFFMLMCLKLISFRLLLKLFVALVCIGTLVITMLSSSDSYKSTLSAFETRWDRTFSSEDGSSGRIDIAMETIDLIAEKPFFGYHFDSFSNYQYEYSTPHNQYLEAIFKTGFLGFVVYFFIFFVFVWVAFCRAKNPKYGYINRVSVTCFMFALTALLIGNITQPNFTYSQTGNVVFLVLGFLSGAKSQEIKAKMILAKGSISNT